MGNITKITASNGGEASYTYDSLNQLKTESITRGGITRVISYTYDSHGNMTSRIEGNKETVYTYDLDRLVQIEEKEDGVTTDTQTLTYDNAGNLITDGEFTYTWQKGRQLQGIAGTDLTTSYKYNENGLRTQKTVNGQTHEYTLLGSSVTREVIRDSSGNILWTIHYSYAGDSTPVSMNVNGTEYYYLKNAQGDITHIVDGDGNEVASYEYDAWGNHLSITGGDIAQLNPYRYRGYRYDSETGLYYLQSRYYNPVISSFINADGAYDTNQGILGHSMYVYCLNNPVNMYDPEGRCGKFLGFLWEVDCKQASCPTSKNYIAPKIIDPVGTYNKGRGYVYIVKDDLLEEMMKNKEKNAVVILDKRTNSDPNMQLQKSHQIKNKKQQKQICRIMLNYNTANPVDPPWTRTLNSLVTEWRLHNFAYRRGYKKERTGDCDFNNADEGMGFWDFIGR